MNTRNYNCNYIMNLICKFYKNTHHSHTRVHTRTLSSHFTWRYRYTKIQQINKEKNKHWCMKIKKNTHIYIHTSKQKTTFFVYKKDSKAEIIMPYEAAYIN